jgi:hypothetical protein
VGILTKFKEAKSLPIALLLADDGLCPFRRQCLTGRGIGQPGRASLDEHRCGFEVHHHLGQCPRYRRQAEV